MYDSAYLYGSWSKGKDLIPGALGVSVHIDQDVDPVGMDTVGSLAVTGDLREVNEVLGLGSNLVTELGAIIRTQGVTENLQPKL